ncbi:FAD binding domain-containing protein [Lineolata rhizophorae]|uniref:FAD binding domain-containing protein n=1 Tax=Lineolata rhizophorae TaxID=578093 RepID=A0A6A6P8G4_9PEZI|nr:FAD binding domain-containing protein [Lineolata rhizophorae]
MTRSSSRSPSTSSSLQSTSATTSDAASSRPNSHDLLDPSAAANGLPRTPAPPPSSDVLVVGAGPSGLMLAANLIRFGIKTEIADSRPERTVTGRADGLQPKTIETLKQMRLAEKVLLKGVRVYDICFWKSTATERLRRKGREIHYPPEVVDLLDPFILLVHQGMVEQLFMDDMDERKGHVRRNLNFEGWKSLQMKNRALEATFKNKQGDGKTTFRTDYIVGCDGAHSMVRKSIPDCRAVGASSDSIWGVIDAEIDTDFPDLWSKAVVHSEQAGSVLIIPRERNMTRMYIELKSETREGVPKNELTKDFVMKRAGEIMQPYYLRWRRIEWFGRYQISQRVASRFSTDDLNVFIAGDASHTHSPKAAQGMNTSMHDAWNLAWKLNLSIRGLAKRSLLETYEAERRKIAKDLISFDYEHANAFSAGDAKALAQNFKTNVRFISGVGAEYAPNVLNVPANAGASTSPWPLVPGCLPPPAKATRFIDANPVDLQLAIPMLGQFRIFVFASDPCGSSRPFLEALGSAHLGQGSLVGRASAAANASYTLQPPAFGESDTFIRPERYTPVSGLFTYALVVAGLGAGRDRVELDRLPPLWRESRWSVYLDDAAELDARRMSCAEKWWGGLARGEVAVVNVRPDGYVGSVARWADGSRLSGERAVRWLDGYYEGFLKGD